MFFPEILLVSYLFAGQAFVLQSSNKDSLRSDTIDCNHVNCPKIMAQPLDDTVCEGNTMSLNVIIPNVYPMYFQWYKDNKALRSSNKPSLPISHATLDDGGEYYCEIKMETACCPNILKSDIATLTVLQCININDQEIKKEKINAFYERNIKMIYITFPDNNEKYYIVLYDLSGRLLYKDVAGSESIKEIDANNIKGVVVLGISNQNSAKSIKLMVN